MQCARAIPVAWLGSGSCQNRPSGWILMVMTVIVVTYKIADQCFSMHASNSLYEEFSYIPRDRLAWLRIFAVLPVICIQCFKFYHWPLCSTSLPVHYSLIIPSFDVMYSEIEATFLNKWCGYCIAMTTSNFIDKRQATFRTNRVQLTFIDISLVLIILNLKFM